MMDAIVVLITAGSEEEAARIANSIVEERLAACVNIVTGIRSIYRWEGRICDEKEALLIVKTREELFDALSEKVKNMHSYTVPEIIAIHVVKGFRPYLSWLNEETSR